MALGQKRAERQERRALTRASTGGGSRKRQKKSKGDLRREMKAQKRIEWQARAGTAANKKAKRDAGSAGTSLRARGAHRAGPCGNLGCPRCFPLLAQRIRSNPKSCDRRRSRV